MATSFEPSEKEGQIGNLRSHIYYGENLVKIGPVDLSFFAQNFISKEKEINASRTL